MSVCPQCQTPVTLTDESLNGMCPTCQQANPRHELVAMVPSDAKRVLEIGCGTGGFGKAMKELRPEVEVIAYEANGKLAREAVDYYLHVWREDVQDLLIPPSGIVLHPSGFKEVRENAFDVLVFGDVVEHLNVPRETISMLCRVLHPGGTVIMSIPNARYAAFTGNVLDRGIFKYEDAGLFDRTHLRFFCKQDMIELVEDAGLELELIRSLSGLSAEDLPYDEGNGCITFGRVVLIQPTEEEIEQIRTYQYLVVARKP